MQDHENQKNAQQDEQLEAEALESENEVGEQEEGITQPEHAQNEEMLAQVEALKAQVLRERADNDNLRKRQERELQSAHKFATERLIKDLLPVMDSLHLGIESAQKNEEATLEQFISGSQMTLKLFEETLARHGVVEIVALGERFDPEKHEAISMVENAQATPNTVMTVAQRGYELNGRVIRPAQVVVAKAVS
ncbi:nucleotide exchange factor GrpE [Rappaport israeli]|uniref:nucleotide exchange factor GrpE n=1 Tax=Rappaport israeli TaxID=1839807 RepID=UPI0009300AC0|nr:nucleotide exchange factor GrpE [Rappaport israeli]